MTSIELEELLKKGAPSGYFEGQNPIYYRTQSFTEEVGVAVFRLYGSNIPFKPSLFSDGKPADVCLLNVVLAKTKSAEDVKVPITVSVDKFNEWFAQHRAWDYRYDPEIEGAPTKKSIALMRKSPIPEDIIISEEFFLDLVSNSFFHRGKKIRGHELLDSAYKIHIKTLSLLSRLRRWLKSFILKASKFMEHFFTWLLSYLWEIVINPADGVNVAMKPGWQNFIHQPKEQPLKLIGIGYEATKKILILYYLILIVVVVCLFKPFISWLALFLASSNPNLLTSILTILVAILLQPFHFLGIWVLQEIVPLFIKAICLGFNRFWWWGMIHL